jgi:predicted transcriptional regulator
MDEFEDRLMNLFQEPVEKYVEKKRAKKQKVEEVKKLDPPIENYVKPATTKVDREEEKPEPIYKRPSFAMPKIPSLHKPKQAITPYKSKQPSYFTKR